MTKTKSLYDYAEHNDIDVIDANIPSECLKGLYFDNIILLDSSIDTEAELRCILAEELAHYETGIGNILDLSHVPAEKQEIKAHRKAHQKLISFDDITAAFNYPCHNAFEISEFIGVTEEFLHEALEHFIQIYGPFVVHNEYVIYFEPLGVMKIFD